ncbi:MAG: hypothetical protein M5U08_19600 [Burkholderiales bacterium]|nr:hypothetical protein [Burkholderiales bacterium]
MMPANALREISGVRQDEPSSSRRWFHSDYFDLFVWQAPDGEVQSFQLCYGIDTSEKALVWRKDIGFFHDGMDPGDPKPGRAPSAILEPDGPFPATAVAARFAREAEGVPNDIRNLVIVRIREFGRLHPYPRSRRRRFRRADWQQRKPN